MKKIYSFLIAICFATLLHAQSTITSDIYPLVGDYVTISICSDLPSGYEDSGADVTWDMGTLIESTAGFFDFVDPATTPYINDFPESTLCGVSWEDSYTYYKTSGTTLEGWGSGFVVDELDPPNDTVKSIHSTAESVLITPFDYLDSYTSDFAGTEEALGFTQDFTGTLDGEYDAYGTLILPDATYENVARFHGERVRTTGFVTQSKEQWIWMSPDYRFWLFFIEYIELTGSEPSWIIWYNNNPISSETGVAENSALQETSVFPNPISPGESIYISSVNPDKGELTILDMNGRVVRSEQVAIGTGTNELAVLSDLERGMYFVRFKGEHTAVNQQLIIR